MHIHQVVLHTGDLAAQRQFYRDAMGLPVQDVGEGFAAQVGATQLVFEQAPAGWREFYHLAFNVPENQLDAAAAWVERFARRLTIGEQGPLFNFPNWNAHSFYFLDAVGNVLECIARHGLPNGSDAPFGPHSLLSVSEVGIGSDDVRGTVAALQEQLGAPIYDGAGNDDFSAVGDEHGLLIIVKRGRIWYPETGVAASASSVVATITQSGRRVGLRYPPLVIETIGQD